MSHIISQVHSRASKAPKNKYLDTKNRSVTTERRHACRHAYMLILIMYNYVQSESLTWKKLLITTESCQSTYVWRHIYVIDLLLYQHKLKHNKYVDNINTSRQLSYVTFEELLDLKCRKPRHMTYSTTKCPKMKYCVDMPFDLFESTPSPKKETWISTDCGTVASG